MTPLEVRTRPNNAWRGLLVCAAALAGVYFFLGYLPFVFWLIGPIAMIALLITAIRGQGTDPVIVIDDEGVLDKRLKVGVIRWEDIRRIKSYSLSGALYISLELHDLKKYDSRRPLWLKSLSQVQRGFGMSSLAISTNGLDVDHSTLVHKIQAGCGVVTSDTRTIEAG